MAIHVIAGILLIILCFYNGLLLAAGSIITGRGLYYAYLLTAGDAHYSKDHLLGSLEYDRAVSTIPGILMLIVASFGLYGAIKRSVSSLLFYAVCQAILVGANGYGVFAKRSQDYSLYNYFNRITHSDVLELMAKGAHYPEFVINFFLILSSIFVASFIYEEKQKEREEVQIQRRRKSKAIQIEPPPKYSDIYSDTTVLVQ